MNLRRLTGVFAGLLLLTAVGSACSDEGSVFSAEVGQCVEEVDDLTGEVAELPTVDCSEDHEGEVLFLFQHHGDDDDFPGGTALQSEAAQTCEGDAFEDYTGTIYDASAILMGYIAPSEESWSEGDRETICVAFLDETVDESFEDNGEEFLGEPG